MSKLSKSCDLKGNQKIFLLQQNQIGSCCRAYKTNIEPGQTLDYFLNKWNQESVQLDQGIELTDCNQCWHDEHQGAISYRQQNNSTDNTIELFLSNLCNHMCSYCSPKFSSQWQDSIQSLGQFRNISGTAKLNLQVSPDAAADQTEWIDQLENYINSCKDNSVVLKLVGGEPLMQINNLKHLLSFNLTKIKTLSIITNLNPPQNKFLHWLLQNIPREKLLIIVSLDATPAYNHVPRAGFDCDRFNANLDLLNKNNIDYYFSSVISVLSIFDLINFLPWVDQTGHRARFNTINNPDCLSLACVPLEFRTKILDQLQGFDVPELVKESLQKHNTVVDLKLFEQYNYLKQYFDRNYIDPESVKNNYFVEYWNWLTAHINLKYETSTSI